MLSHARLLLIVALAPIPSISRADAADPAPDARGKPARARKHLLLDERIVESADNARLMLGTVRKEPRNPLFTEDKPWEPRFDNLYANVLYDEHEQIYKCWYSPFIVDQAVTRTPREKRKTLEYLDALHGNEREMGICYATSTDGVRWTKPELNVVEFEGSRRNNIVLRRVHGAGIWKDAHETDPSRRYKLFGKTDDAEPLGVAFSADGLHWSKPVVCNEIGAAGDTHNNAFWDERLSRYVGITRLWDKQRIVGRCESPDFRTWTKAVPVFAGKHERQTYAMPVFQYAGLYLGLVMILDTRTDVVDCELAWSTDGIAWKRICEGTPLIPRGPDGSFDDGCIYAAALPIVRGDEILLYYGGSDDTHGSWRAGGFGLARLRPDGFAGYEPADPKRPASILTRPITPANRLLVSTDADGGNVRVHAVAADGSALARSRPITSSVTDAPVEWEEAGPASVLPPGTTRLKFELTRARMYAFSLTGE